VTHLPPEATALLRTSLILGNVQRDANFQPGISNRPSRFFCRVISDQLSSTISVISPATKAWLFACRRQTPQGHLAIFTFAIFTF
jgi:hypothetical protein